MPNYHYIPPEQKQLICHLSLSLKTHEIAYHTGINVRTIRRVIGLWRKTGSVNRKPLQAGRPRALTGYHISYVEGLIERQPDIYLSEIQDQLLEAFNITASLSTISLSLKRRGYTRKKISRAAIERDEERRNQYQALIAEYPPETHVYVDESACNRHTSNRGYAWAPTGDRARRHDYFVRGTRYSILPAISLDGVLHLDIITHSWTAEEFRKYIDILLDQMNPYPLRNSVLIMDNASTHHFEGLREMVEACGRHLIYLPPYSPDFNPIEEGFSAMKAWIRRHQHYLLAEMSGGEGCDVSQLLWEAVFETMTPEAIVGWYRDSGYLV